MNNYLRAKVIEYLDKKQYIYNYEKDFLFAQNSATCSLSMRVDGYDSLYKQQKIRLPQSFENKFFITLKSSAIGHFDWRASCTPLVF